MCGGRRAERERVVRRGPARHRRDLPSVAERCSAVFENTSARQCVPSPQSAEPPGHASISASFEPSRAPAEDSGVIGRAAGDVIRDDVTCLLERLSDMVASAEAAGVGSSAGSVEPAASGDVTALMARLQEMVASAGSAAGGCPVEARTPVSSGQS